MISLSVVFSWGMSKKPQTVDWEIRLSGGGGTGFSSFLSSRKTFIVGHFGSCKNVLNQSTSF